MERFSTPGDCSRRALSRRRRARVVVGSAIWVMTLACASTGTGGQEVMAAPRGSAETSGPPAGSVGASSLLEGRTASARGDDAAAIAWIREGLRDPAIDDQLRFELRRELLLALARGGAPQEALSLARAMKNDDRLATLDLRRAEGAASDRGDDPRAAALALVRWRELLRDDAPETRYVETRLRARLERLSDAELDALAAGAGEGDVGACFRARRAGFVSGEHAGWVGRCTFAPRVVGVSLPRTGPLSALAEEHLAALSAAVELLAERRDVEVLFRDSGSTPASAADAAAALLARGAEWIVGPAAATQVPRVAAAGAPMVIVGEPSGSQLGAAPALGARLRALLAHARASGKRRVLVLTPASAYGDAAAAKTRAAADTMDDLRLEQATFAADGSDLPTVLDRIAGTIGEGTAVLVPDALARAVFVVQQIRRREPDGQRALILLTAEGLAPGSLARAGRALEGDIFAPLVGPAADVARFDEAFFRREGTRPSDQARLVFRALARAWSGGGIAGTTDASAQFQVGLYQLRGGALVPLES